MATRRQHGGDVRSQTFRGRLRKSPRRRKHRAKLREIYRPRLVGHIDDRMLEEAQFFAAYQVLRNVWHMLSVPGSRLLFLLPRSNIRLWNELAPTLATLDSATRERISAIAIEDVFSELRQDASCPQALRQYAASLEAKYVIGTS